MTSIQFTIAQAGDADILYLDLEYFAQKIQDTAEEQKTN